MDTQYDIYCETPTAPHGETDQFFPMLVNQHFDGFTVTPALGYWKGKPENVTRCTIIADGKAHTVALIEALARDLREAYGQECVLVTSHPVAARFI